MEMPEGWKRQHLYYKSLLDCGTIEKPCEQQLGLELLKEMAEAMQRCLDAMEGCSNPDTYGVQDLEDPLKKFKEWK